MLEATNTFRLEQRARVAFGASIPHGVKLMTRPSVNESTLAVRGAESTWSSVYLSGTRSTIVLLFNVWPVARKGF